jgi:L-ribulose-5-phosphate 4-epimerase
MLEELKKQVCEANLRLAASGLVIETWGNVSGVDRPGDAMVIKPSGVPYEGMTPEHMVAVSLATGAVLDGGLKPSSDMPTHLELYRAFGGVGGVVHTHSIFATAWAQARKAIPPLGTTHADYFCGPVPCTRPMTAEEILDHYEANTGKVIVERFSGGLQAAAYRGLEATLDPLVTPAVLVAGHGPFAWGRSPQQAVENAIVLEHLAHLAILTLGIEPYSRPISQELLQKHFFRKHGPGRYYGQD